MEPLYKLSFSLPKVVLILIIMEDTHGVRKKLRNMLFSCVLILIIMEDTHGGARLISLQTNKQRS